MKAFTIHPPDEQEVDRQADHPILGQSRPVADLRCGIDRVAPTDVTVLIQGESGVGKELVARALHRQSRRAHRPLVVVDCTSLHEQLMQSELFGHEQGAFTGAHARKQGLFEVADRGTLFLDEIAELPLLLQSRLLRVLESRAIRRVGGTVEVPVDVRVLAATNRDLPALIERGTFRPDLFYRLNVFPIVVPPLRARSIDIRLLFDHFIRTSPIPERRGLRIDPEVYEVLARHDWPGNVRELQNVAVTAVLLCDSELLDVHHLPAGLRSARRSDLFEAGVFPTLEARELDHIRRALEYTHGHRHRAAEVLGISERSLYRRLKELSAPSSMDLS